MAASYMRNDEPLIDIVGVGKGYDTRQVVRDVTLRLMPGDIVGLVGANGGGKTTTLRMLAGLIQPDSGTGQVLGVDVADRLRRRRVLTGYMPQRLSLYRELSVIENLLFRGRVHRLANAKDVIAQAIVRWGLEEVVDRRVAQLSGGWSRRVQFAATMLHAPPLMLLDEPTAGLDVVTRNQIWHWLGELAALGHGIVVATHDLAEAERGPAILHYRDGIALGPLSPAALIALGGGGSLEAAVTALALRDAA